MEVTDRYFVYFGFEETILVSVGRKKKYFTIWASLNLKKINAKLGKMTFYVVILAISKFTVISHCAGHMAIEFGFPGTYKRILKKKIFGQLKFNFTT